MIKPITIHAPIKINGVYHSHVKPKNTRIKNITVNSVASLAFIYQSPTNV